MTTAPTRKALAAFTRKLVEQHDEWDSLHTFVTLYQDGNSGVRVGTWAAISSDVDPRNYPAHMFGIVSREVAKTLAGGGVEIPCAFVLQIEAWSVVAPPDDADPIHRAILDADRNARQLHTRPDAVENCESFCVDLDGHVWTARKRRDEPGEIKTRHYPPGDRETPVGTMMQALTSCAEGMRTVRATLAGQK